MLKNKQQHPFQKKILKYIYDRAITTIDCCGLFNLPMNYSHGQIDKCCKEVIFGDGVLWGVVGKHNYPQEIITVPMEPAYPENVSHRLSIPYKNALTE